jgi:transcription elongation factor Elf1
MKSVEDVLKENKNIYLWKDKSTLDIEVNNNISILEELIKFICLKCENNALEEESKVLKSITESDTGANIICKNCSQKWFVHKPIVLPKNLEKPD